MVDTSAKLYVRGAITNGLGLSLLGLVAWSLGLGFHVAIASGMQYTVFLIHGLPQNSEKYYDLSGSFTHFAVVAASLMRETRARTVRQIFAALASTVWMTRLGSFLYARILRDGNDARFDHLKRNWLAFMGAWTLQATWVTLVQLPVLLLNDFDDVAPFTLLDGLAMAGWFTGFIVEAIADSEKMAFRDKAENKGKYITTGIWQYSRHPNYFGEILMWCSLALAASSVAMQLSSARALFASWISPAFTALLLLRVSGLPMVEKAGMEKWGNDPAYLHYVAKTSCIVPWFPAGPFPQVKTD